MQFQIYHPARPGLVAATFSDDGTTSEAWLANAIDQLRRGIGADRARALRCVPILRGRRARLKDCTTLGQLFAARKARGSTAGLQPIAEEHRYAGKVDWQAKRSWIRERLIAGWSVRQIAKELGVSHTTLSKANHRHDLYPTRRYRLPGDGTGEKAKKAEIYVGFTSDDRRGNTSASPGGESNANGAAA